MTQRLTILKSIPAIGDVTALTLLAEMPELGDLNDKQAASWLGVAHMARDSGTWKGKRFIRGGRATVPRAVYMATLSAMRFNADMKVKYHTLVKAGKPTKLALTVIMRKLIILANALIKDNDNGQKLGLDHHGYSSVDTSLSEQQDVTIFLNFCSLTPIWH